MARRQQRRRGDDQLQYYAAAPAPAPVQNGAAELAMETFMLEVVGGIAGVKKIEYAGMYRLPGGYGAANAIARGDVDMDDAHIVSLDTAGLRRFRSLFAQLFGQGAYGFVLVYQLTSVVDRRSDKHIQNLFAFTLENGNVSHAPLAAEQIVGSVDDLFSRPHSNNAHLRFGPTLPVPRHYTVDYNANGDGGTLRRAPGAPAPVLTGLYAFNPYRMCRCCGESATAVTPWYTDVVPAPRQPTRPVAAAPAPAPAAAHAPPATAAATAARAPPAPAARGPVAAPGPLTTFARDMGAGLEMDPESAAAFASRAARRLPRPPASALARADDFLTRELGSRPGRISVGYRAAVTRLSKRTGRQITEEFADSWQMDGPRIITEMTAQEESEFRAQLAWAFATPDEGAVSVAGISTRHRTAEINPVYNTPFIDVYAYGISLGVTKRLTAAENREDQLKDRNGIPWPNERYL